MNDFIKVENIFNNIPQDLTVEVFQDLLTQKNIRIERIISKGQKSPEGFWYDQDESEWVILLKGYAEIQFEDHQKPFILNAGDYLNIPAHKKHRVEKTDESEITIWLAIFY
ncbi:MAG: cupin domain-containing protein [Candidatus Kapabacteria bacterium]|nr:cupin domain-containing protein [Candidatus Kapabacteria bacterium]